MDTSVSYILTQTECIWLDVAERSNIKEVLKDVKALATRENKMVMFAVPGYGQLFQVTGTSDIDKMLLQYFDRYDCPFIIT